MMPLSTACDAQGQILPSHAVTWPGHLVYARMQSIEKSQYLTGTNGLQAELTNSKSGQCGRESGRASCPEDGYHVLNSTSLPEWFSRAR